MAGVFAFSAAVQINDPDPVLWIGLYAAAAAVSALFARRKVHWVVPCVLLLVSVGWAGVLIPEVLDASLSADVVSDWKMRSVGVEVVREAGGLGIVALWALILTLVTARQSTWAPKAPSK